MKTAALHSLGCKVNAYETAAMRRMLEEDGYRIVPFDERADVYVINTCTVTNIADRKSRQMLRRARKQNPNAIVVAVGCYAQSLVNKGLCDEEDAYVSQGGLGSGEEEYPLADIVLGTDKKGDLVAAINRFLSAEAGGSKTEGMPDVAESKSKAAVTRGAEPGSETERAEIGTAGSKTERAAIVAASKSKAAVTRETESGSETEGMTNAAYGDRVRAFIKVQDGCDRFCSYCVIPFVRGRSRSREKDDIIREVRQFAENGCREVILTGIHLSSYGERFEKDGGLLSLIEAVSMVDGITRIRLGSLEPGIITERFVERLSKAGKICPHFHLSLQSGCDATLKRMNRHYTSGEYMRKCRLLREYFDDPALTTDVIAGFPGESEEDFRESMAFIDSVDFYETHIFKYSRRDGTAAAQMEGQIAEEEKTRRSALLSELDRKKRRMFEARHVGKNVEVLVEERILRDEKYRQVGHTREYMPVGILSDEDLRGRTVNVLLEDGRKDDARAVIFRK